MDEERKRDEALFEAIGNQKKKRRRRTVLTVVITVAVVIAALIIAVIVLQRQVRNRFAAAGDDVLSYAAATGSISTTVSGSGQLADVDVETVTVPAGVEIGGMAVEANQTVSRGDILATLDMSTVMSAMADVQEALDSLDEQLAEAAGDEVDSAVTAGVSGRIKTLYGAAGDSVADVMTENGALAILSLDGYMALDIQTDALSAGDPVTVTVDGESYSGTVETAAGGTATVLITDKGPALDAEAVVTAEDSEEILGRGTLYVHSPLRITGFAGTIDGVSVSEGDWVDADDTVFTLTDTSYSANYDAILRRRADKEAEMLELLTLYEDGALRAPFAGSVQSVLWSENSGSQTAQTTQSAVYAAGTAGEAAETEVLTLSPDREMDVTIAVDEGDILALEPGQTASVTVASLDDAEFTGVVTEIDKSGGGGQYTAVVTLDKDGRMLSGMTAQVKVRIEGTEGALIIPADALHRTSAGAYVYTAYDEQTETYGGMHPVTVGLENDDYAEITDGLSEGETVYYVESEPMGFGIFGGFGGGMPGGGFGGGSREP